MAFNYKDYLQEKLTDLTDLKVKVVDELDFKIDADIKVIIKKLTGTIYQGTTIQPIQIYALSSNLVDTKMLLESFTEAFTRSRDRYDFKNFKQVYSTPVVLENFIPVGNKQISAVYVNATLTILEDVTDISELKIDNVKIDFIDFQENYIVQTTSKKVAGNELSTNKKQTSTYSITITFKNSNNKLCRKIRDIRHGIMNGNELFNIAIYYDDIVEPYVHNMVVIDHNIVTGEQNIPINTITFGVAD